LFPSLRQAFSSRWACSAWACSGGSIDDQHHVGEAAIGTDALNPDTDGDGFDDGEEVLELGTDPLDPLDPEPDPVPEPAGLLQLGAGLCFLVLLRRVSRRG
jgi:hypothetical protein